MRASTIAFNESRLTKASQGLQAARKDSATGLKGRLNSVHLQVWQLHPTVLSLSLIPGTIVFGACQSEARLRRSPAMASPDMQMGQLARRSSMVQSVLRSIRAATSTSLIVTT